MTATVVEQAFKTALAKYALPGGTYDSTKLGLSSLMTQMVGGTNQTDWIGPHPVGLARPMEQSVAIPGFMPFAMTWDAVNGVDWVFLADNAAAAVTRRISLYTFTRSTGTFLWQGFITLTYPITGTSHTIRGLRAAYRKESTGTASASGTSVTGVGSAFNTNKMCIGSRIGFGSTDPTQITTWYQIATISSDTALTLTTSAGTVGSGAYVIEDLMILTATTNGTLADGGLFVTKGVQYGDFNTIGTTIPAATTVDLIKAVYWLADAAVETNTIAMGMGLENFVDSSDQFVWVPNLTSATTVALYKYNFRAALTLTAGKDSGNTLVFSTGVITITGTATQVNNGRIFTMASGPGSGLSCFYFTTSTRVYRSVAVGTITIGSVAWNADVMTEVPPGSASTFAATNALGNMDYADSIDKLVIAPSAAADRLYVTGYNSVAAQLDRIMWSETRQLDQSLADSSTTPYPNTLNDYTVYAQGGTLYAASITGITASTNFLYAFPVGADWEYNAVSGQQIILPAMNTANCNKFMRAYTNDLQVLGGDTGHNLGVSMMGYKLFWRTAGISDNSGAWTQLDYSGDLSSVAGATQIQFMLQFRSIGEIATTARVLNVGVVYDDLSTDSHYQPSVNNSNPSTSKFAWRFAVAFGSSVPALRVRLYDAVLGSLLVDDNTGAPSGTFERSTDGGSTWTAWNNTDLGASTTTYLRYTPASLGSGINVRSLLTLN